MITPTTGMGLSLFKKKSVYHEQIQQKQLQTPQSPNYTSNIDVKNLQRTQMGLIKQFDAFVLGVSGGDCAGKKQLLSFMFQKIQDKTQQVQKWSWKIVQTGQSVAVLHQHYFYKSQTEIHSSKGTDWQKFKKKALSLSLGNQVRLNIYQKGKQKKVKILPAKVLCIEGSHIFSQKSLVNDIMNLRVFIDSDSDTRLSRRIYKDTVEGCILLDASILKYLTEIKPSYEQEIQPTKVKCDVVVPHFGNGFSDHLDKDRRNLDLNIKNIRNLLLSHIRSAMKFYNHSEHGEQKQNHQESVKNQKKIEIKEQKANNIEEKKNQ